MAADRRDDELNLGLLCFVAYRHMEGRVVEALVAAGDTGSTAGSGSGPAGWLLALAAVGGGAAAGAAVGGVQAWAARGYATRRGGWVAVNVVAWTMALAWIFLLAAIPGSNWPVWAVTLDGVVAGLGSGLVVGLVTSVWVPRLQPSRSGARTLG